MVIINAFPGLQYTSAETKDCKKKYFFLAVKNGGLHQADFDKKECVQKIEAGSGSVANQQSIPRRPTNPLRRRHRCALNDQ